MSMLVCPDMVSAAMQVSAWPYSTPPSRNSAASRDTPPGPSSSALQESRLIRTVRSAPRAGSGDERPAPSLIVPVSAELPKRISLPPVPDPPASPARTGAMQNTARITPARASDPRRRLPAQPPRLMFIRSPQFAVENTCLFFCCPRAASLTFSRPAPRGRSAGRCSPPRSCLHRTAGPAGRESCG